ncbi:unnamed protein product [Phytophthora lilii]|uniref:Unnamed protein product n=1 Tax=Phytophthora lilii TaxID=2077276 RepID=A0A9W6U1D2_9STRA|nr:unnamed protein product [Phytophthora lilii]
MYDALAHLLEAMCLLYKGIQPFCFKVLQLFDGSGFFQAATMQPVVFSLIEGIEKDRKGESTKSSGDTMPVDLENTTELARLLDTVEPGFGVEFFSSRNTKCSTYHILEAHWRGITVNVSTGVTTCEFCTNYMQSPLFHKVRGVPTEHNDALLRTHCAEVYQPLKRFMVQNLKHVRYVRPPRGWNRAPNPVSGAGGPHCRFYSCGCPL